MIHPGYSGCRACEKNLAKISGTAVINFDNPCLQAREITL